MSALGPGHVATQTESGFSTQGTRADGGQLAGSASREKARLTWPGFYSGDLNLISPSSPKSPPPEHPAYYGLT